MTVTDSERGTKRSIDDSLDSDEDAHWRYGKLLWDSMVYQKKVTGLIKIKSQKDGQIMFHITGFDSHGVVRISAHPIWSSFADIWLTTLQNPRETVETLPDLTNVPQPTKKEMERRMSIFMTKALEEQKKLALSMFKPYSRPTFVPSSTHHRRRDVFDDLADAARARSIQETYAATNALKATHCKEMQEVRKEIERLTEEKRKEINEEQKSRKNDAEKAEAKIKGMTQELEGAKREKERLMKEVNTISKAIKLAVKETQEHMAKHHNNELQGITAKHNKEKQSLLEEAQNARNDLDRLTKKARNQLARRTNENEQLSRELEKEKLGRCQDAEEREKLERRNHALQTKLDQIMAVVTDASSS